MSDETAHLSDSQSAEGGIPSGTLTQILEDLRQGDMKARERLVAVVYDELRELAAVHLRRERAAHTLQPTALVHEVFLRLFGSAAGSLLENRAHFFGAAAEAMRRILVDFARRQQALKRGGGVEAVGIDDVEAGDNAAHSERLATVLGVDEALNRLAAQDERKRKLVELRFFAGLTMEEAAETLGISLATAKRDWAFAKAWLFRELGDCVATIKLDG